MVVLVEKILQVEILTNIKIKDMTIIKEQELFPTKVGIVNLSIPLTTKTASESLIDMSRIVETINLMKTKLPTTDITQIATLRAITETLETERELDTETGRREGETKTKIVTGTVGVLNIETATKIKDITGTVLVTIPVDPAAKILSLEMIVSQKQSLHPFPEKLKN